jgi:hypothetical protein
MIESVRDYLVALTEGFGQGWNRFWFTRRDPCVLGVMRLLTGIVAFYVIASYGPDLDTLFSEDGLLSVENVEKLQTQFVSTLDSNTPQERKVWRFSYIDFLKTPRELWLGHVAGLVVLALFTVGFRARIMSVLALLVVLSYVHRGPQLTSQVEPILTMVMFYLCIGPTGASCSVDAWLAKRRVASLTNPAKLATGIVPSVSANLATRLIQVHMTVLFAMMGLGKLVAAVWWEGAAAWWLFARPDSQLFDLRFMADHVYLINAWTHAIVLYELTFPVLVWNRLARPLMLALGLIYVVLVALASGLITYALMLFIANLAFVSPGFMRSMLACSRKSPVAVEAA